MKIKVKRKELFYYLGLIVSSFYVIVIYLTNFVSTLSPAAKLPIILVAVGLMMASLIQFRQRIVNVILGVIFIILTIYLVQAKNDYLLILSVFEIICAYKVDYKKIFIVNAYSSIFCVLLVFLFSLLGILPNSVYGCGGLFSKAYGMGFLYYSTYAYCLFFASTILFLYKSHKKNLYAKVAYFLFNVFVFAISTVQLTLLLSLFILIFVRKKRSERNVRLNAAVKFLNVFMYPINMLINFAIAMMTSLNNPIVQKINVLSGYRISYMTIAVKRYPLNMFGNEIITRSFDKDNYYFYLDNGYLSFVIRYGLIFAVAVIALYAVISYYALKTNDSKLMMLLVVVCLFNYVNSCLIDITSNPLLLCSYTAILYINKEKKEKKRGHRYTYNRVRV